MSLTTYFISIYSFFWASILAGGAPARKGFGRFCRTLLGLLRHVARLPGQPERIVGDKVATRVRRIVRDSNRLRYVGRPDHQNGGEERRTVDGAYASVDALAQQRLGTGGSRERASP